MWQLLQYDFPMRFEKGLGAIKSLSGKAERKEFPNPGKDELGISDFIMTEINRTYSLRIRLMLVKKTIPGIIMNPITKTLNTIVQLSPIYAPLN